MIHHDTTFVSFKLFTVAKKPLVKLTLTAALIGAAAIQTACSATTLGSESPSMPASETPETANASPHPSTSMSAVNDASTASDHAADNPGSVIPPLGSFDRRDPDFVQYKPCLEMPDEFLAQAGLYGKEMMIGIGIDDGICSFTAGSEYGDSVFNLQGSHHSFTSYQDISGEIAWHETAGGTPILLHKTQYLPESECQASVETVQGTLSITFQSFNTMDSQVISDPCDVATNKLETVLALDGKNED